eukprot:6492558-Amphidinium_carterae.2
MLRVASRSPRSGITMWRLQLASSTGRHISHDAVVLNPSARSLMLSAQILQQVLEVPPHRPILLSLRAHPRRLPVLPCSRVLTGRCQVPPLPQLQDGMSVERFHHLWVACAVAFLGGTERDVQARTQMAHVRMAFPGEDSDSPGEWRQLYGRLNEATLLTELLPKLCKAKDAGHATQYDCVIRSGEKRGVKWDLDGLLTLRQIATEADKALALAMRKHE